VLTISCVITALSSEVHAHNVMGMRVEGVREDVMDELDSNLTIP
jgi:hypothetical protein